MIRLLVGLGNPGAEHAEQRHNAGFWLVSQLAETQGATWKRERAFDALTARVPLATPDGTHDLWLLLPQTYMNRSGQAVRAFASFYKIAPPAILVVHDELDLPPGQVKLKQGGGHAGHNGLRDLHAQLPSDDYWRLRLGIGHPGDKSQVVSWVLNRPREAERHSIQDAITRSLQALPLIVAGQTLQAMNQLHAGNPAKSAKPDKASPPTSKDERQPTA